MKCIYRFKKKYWRVDIMVNHERMTKVCYSYDDAVQAAKYIRSFLTLKYKRQRGNDMYTINADNQIVPMTDMFTKDGQSAIQTFTFPVTGRELGLLSRMVSHGS